MPCHAAITLFIVYCAADENSPVSRSKIGDVLRLRHPSRSLLIKWRNSGPSPAAPHRRLTPAQHHTNHHNDNAAETTEWSDDVAFLPTFGMVASRVKWGYEEEVGSLVIGDWWCCRWWRKYGYDVLLFSPICYYIQFMYVCCVCIPPWFLEVWYIMVYGMVLSCHGTILIVPYL